MSVVGYIGYPVEKLKRYLSNGLDILTVGCDDSPAYSKLDPNEEHLNAEGTDLDDELPQPRLECAITNELAICLQERKCISWFLMKHGKIVTRKEVHKVTNAIRSKAFKIIHIEHLLRAGVTTICRHALYQLHREYLCVQITDGIDIDAIEDIIVQLKLMSERCGLPLLILIDLKEKTTIADALLDYSKKR